jgi:hypothetical protein
MLYDAKHWEPKVGLVPKKKKRRKATKATFRRRLLKLASMLEADAKNPKGLKFDLDYIGVKDGFGFVSDFVSYTDGYEKDFDPGLNCQTTGCAMGLAAMSGEFKRAGLSYRVDGIWISPTIYGRESGYISAAKRIFGVTEDEAEYLFSPDYYPQNKINGAKAERLVVRRIRSVVAGTHLRDMKRRLLGG